MRGDSSGVPGKCVGQSLGAHKDSCLGVSEYGACPPSTIHLRTLIYPTARLTFRESLECFWPSFAEDFSMTSSTKRLCVFPINEGLLFFPLLLLFPHAFPENLHGFNSFGRTCGSLHSGLCDVVNPRSDLQCNHPESDLQSSTFKWFIASACRPLAVSVLALACLHKLPKGQIWSESLSLLGRKGWEVLAAVLLCGTLGQLKARGPLVQLVEHDTSNTITREHTYWWTYTLNANHPDGSSPLSIYEVALFSLEPSWCF